MASRLWILIATAFAAIVFAVPEARAQTSASEVKAAFLPRFARYVTWPPSARPSGSEPFVLCVIGNDPFGNSLDVAVRSQSVDGRRIVVRRMDSASGSGGCHIAFVAGSRSQPIGQQLAALRGRPILTVTDSGNGGQHGMIHFSIVSGRVRFFIDEAEARGRGLTISSRLLALAIGVTQR
ncbi:MAG TPA: YfiR family protein [Sphingomicrobium sp.]|nr:YfiR family protein [Sphingomicrobium sp.]